MVFVSMWCHRGASKIVKLCKKINKYNFLKLYSAFGVTIQNAGNL